MTLNREFVLQWAEALESGEYEQGRAALHYVERQPDKALFYEDGEHKYCCLGVAMVLLAEMGIVKPMEFNESTGIYSHDDPVKASLPTTRTENLAKTACTYIGLDATSGLGQVEGRPWLPFDTAETYTRLSEANDDGLTFNQIARALRKLIEEQDAQQS